MAVEESSLFAQRGAADCAEELTRQRRYRSEMHANDNKENDEEKEAPTGGRRRARDLAGFLRAWQGMGAFRCVAARHYDSMP